MIPNIVFIALRYAFIGLLYIFLILVIRAIYRDIKSPEEKARPAKRNKREQPQLVVITADRNVGAKYMLTDEILIGRAASSDVLIDDTYASQQHARIFPHDSVYCVEDLGSTNGTYVNGRKISYPLELRVGDRIKIGKTVFEFRI